VRVRRIEDGTLVIYDEHTDKGHVLNPALAVVYDACDGTTSLAEMARRVANRTELPEDEQIVLMALGELRQAGLLDVSFGDRSVARARHGLTRRSLLKRVALGVGALAVLPTLESVAGVSQLVAQTGLSVFAAVALSIQTSAGVPVTFQLRATGVPGSGSLMFKVITPPRHGLGVINGDLLTYTPAPGYEGPDSLTYQAILDPSATTTSTTTGSSTTTTTTRPTESGFPTTTTRPLRSRSSSIFISSPASLQSLINHLPQLSEGHSAVTTPFLSGRPITRGVASVTPQQAATSAPAVATISVGPLQSLTANPSLTG
jgi:hypothetical protein